MAQSTWENVEKRRHLAFWRALKQLLTFTLPTVRLSFFLLRFFHIINFLCSHKLLNMFAVGRQHNFTLFWNAYLRFVFVLLPSTESGLYRRAILQQLKTLLWWKHLHERPTHSSSLLWNCFRKNFWLWFEDRGETTLSAFNWYEHPKTTSTPEAHLTRVLREIPYHLHATRLFMNLFHPTRRQRANFSHRDASLKERHRTVFLRAFRDLFQHIACFGIQDVPWTRKYFISRDHLWQSNFFSTGKRARVTYALRTAYERRFKTWVRLCNAKFSNQAGRSMFAHSSFVS